jgi:hypothetical protein
VDLEEKASKEMTSSGTIGIGIRYNMVSLMMSHPHLSNSDLVIITMELLIMLL